MALWKWPQWGGSPASAAASPKERRTAPRHRASRVTSCRIITLPSNVPIQVKLRDISLSGLGLLADSQLTKGAFLMIDLQGAKAFQVRLRAQVVHATLQADGYWAVGCVLERTLDREEMEALL